MIISENDIFSIEFCIKLASQFLAKYASMRKTRYLSYDKIYSGNTRLKKSRKVGQKQTPQGFCGDLFIPGGWGGIPSHDAYASAAGQP